MTASPPRAGRREWAGLAVLALPALLASMDLSVLFIAVPPIAAELRPTGPQLLWVLDVYGFLMAGLLLATGALGDRVGRRRVLLAGAALFAAASILAARATSVELLIAARALLGIGGAALAPSSLALLRDVFAHDGQRRLAVGVWTAAFTGGVAIGPIVGGLVVERFGWGAVFLLNVPVMVLLLVAGPVLLPESRAAGAGRFDLPGAAQATAAVLLLVHAGKEIAHSAAVPPSAAASLLAGAVLGAWFVRRQGRVAAPLLDLRLFREPAFGAAVAAHATAVLVSAGTGFLVSQYLQVVAGLRPFTAALWQLPAAVGAVLGIAAATAAASRLRPVTAPVAGLLVSAAGLGLLGLVAPASDPGLVAGCYAVLGVGTGAVAARAVETVVSAAPPQRAGAAAGIGETAAEFGGALGIALLGSVASTGGHLGDPAALAAGVAAAALVGAGLLAVAAVAVGIGLRGAPAPHR